MMKSPLTISIDTELLERARGAHVSFSRICEAAIRAASVPTGLKLEELEALQTELADFYASCGENWEKYLKGRCRSILNRTGVILSPDKLKELMLEYLKDMQK